VCRNGNEVREIDSRTSDAIALALRFKCPIYTYESIMQEAGIILSELEGEQEADVKGALQPEGGGKSKKGKEDLSQLSVEELELLLSEAIDEENYILAAKVRDEIKHR